MADRVPTIPVAILTWASARVRVSSRTTPRTVGDRPVPFCDPHKAGGAQGCDGAECVVLWLAVCTELGKATTHGRRQIEGCLLKCAFVQECERMSVRERVSCESVRASESVRECARECVCVCVRVCLCVWGASTLAADPPEWVPQCAPPSHALIPTIRTDARRRPALGLCQR